MQDFSNENEFDLEEDESVGGTHFYMNDFGRRLRNGLFSHPPPEHLPAVCTVSQ